MTTETPVAEPVKHQRTRKVNPYKVYVSGGGDESIAYMNGQIGKCRDWIVKNKAAGLTYAIRKDFGCFKVETTTKDELVEL